MRRMFLALWLSASFCAMCVQPLHAQTANSNSPAYDKQFYVFVSSGVLSGVQFNAATQVDPYRSLQVGGAAEGFLVKGLAVGAELAASPKLIKSKPFTYTYRTSAGNEATASYATTGVKGWGSLNLSYHFKGVFGSSRWVPFVTAGGTFFARDGLGEAKNYGGGFSLWTHRRRGFRLEYRKHIADEGSFNSCLRSVRVGLVFR